MQSKRLTTLLSGAILLGALGALSTPARAETEADASFSGMVKMARMDKNKDGMVSRAEFLEMMGKVYDMKAKEMKAKGGMMSSDDFKQFLMYLRAGA